MSAEMNGAQKRRFKILKKKRKKKGGEIILWGTLREE
jgi:hypothetical protein